MCICAALRAHCAVRRPRQFVCNSGQEYLPLGRFSETEEQGFAALKAELRGSIQKGVDFVRKGS